MQKKSLNEFYNYIFFKKVVALNPNLADEHENKLYNHLISGYTSLVKPVRDNNDVVTISIDLRLSRLIDIDEKNQIMTTDLWITQIWNDYRLIWNSTLFNNISSFHMPANQIWVS